MSMRDFVKVLQSSGPPRSTLLSELEGGKRGSTLELPTLQGAASGRVSRVRGSGVLHTLNNLHAMALSGAFRSSRVRDGWAA